MPVHPLKAEFLYGFTEDPSDDMAYFAPVPVLHADTISILATITDPSTWPDSIPHPRPGLRLVRRAMWSQDARNVILVETNTVLLSLTLPADVVNQVAGTATSLILAGLRARRAPEDPAPPVTPWVESDENDLWSVTIKLTPRQKGPTIL